jgi:nucleotide-binding universal stress UspA family protein
VGVTNDGVFKTILVGDNGTPDAARAIEVAISLGRSLNAKVILLNVVAPPSAESQAEGYGLETAADAHGRLEDTLSRASQASLQSSVDVVTEIVEGDPEKVIEQRAEQDSVDLIVVGHRDIAQVRRWLEGSTSEGLVRRSPTSVRVVPDGSAKP